MSCVSENVCKFTTLIFLITGSLMFYTVYDTVENTSFDVASRHMSAVHNYACEAQPNGRIYMVIRDPGNVVDQTTTADIIIGKVSNMTAIVSTAYSFVTANQYFQYTGRMPFEDKYGLYFDVCVHADTQYDMAYGKTLAISYAVLFCMLWVVIFLLMCTDCICATVWRRGRYEEIN